ncbi:MAG: hypothetical protein PHR24_06130 [Oscillospiraceae bacterium]|nr:hypothetical protein [Oscillospiraceae bacterium]MDD3832869.1 hypothetical protein [Oscillospiraceae bacterium]MDD4546857.1 hypothetical protein [Oscillospiraceae bacterium]
MMMPINKDTVGSSRFRSAANNVAVLAVCTAIILVQQIVLAGLPNIELVSLLVIVYAQTFRFKSLNIIYVFALMQGILYGFHIWWFSYLYVWTILALISIALRKVRSPLIWAVISGMYGLCFGALCAIPYIFIGGPAMAIAYWVSGIPFDFIHCVSNFILCLLLWKPLTKLTFKMFS